MAIKCMQCGIVFANSTVVMKKGCRCGNRELSNVTNPFAVDKPVQEVKIITPEATPVLPEAQPPIKKTTD